MIYFFKDKKLAHALKQNSVSEKQQLVYLMFFWLLFSAVSLQTVNASLYANAKLTAYDHIIDLISIASIVISVFACFKINEKGDNKRFVERFMSISFPIGIKVILITLVLSTLTLFLDNPDYFSENQYATTDPLSGYNTLLGAIITYVYMIWRYITCFAIMNSEDQNV